MNATEGKPAPAATDTPADPNLPVLQVPDGMLRVEERDVPEAAKRVLAAELNIAGELERQLAQLQQQFQVQQQRVRAILDATGGEGVQLDPFRWKYFKLVPKSRAARRVAERVAARAAQPAAPAGGKGKGAGAVRKRSRTKRGPLAAV